MEQADETELIREIAERALAYLTDPPRGDDPVVNFASPDELIRQFNLTAELSLDGDGSGTRSDVLLAAVDQVIHHSVQTSHPRFMNQNFAGPDPVAVVGDWLGAALNTTGATFEAAPVFTLMESAVLAKLAQLVGYVNPTDIAPGMFAPGGSTAALYALQLARHRHDPDIIRSGRTDEQLVFFVSDSGHYSAAKCAAMLGLGMDAAIKVATDATGAMDVAALRQAIVESRQDGLTPFAVIATAGTTVTSAFDDFDVIADICEAHGLWMHVDACYGGSALFSPSHRHLLWGAQRSDSLVWNLHKMMGITQQCTALLVKDPSQLAPCFATGADYLFQPDKQFAEYDSGDRTFQCARRIDVLKLWLAWKARGDDGFAARIDHAVALADYTRQAITANEGAFVELAGSFTNVVFVWVPHELRPFELASAGQAVRERLHTIPPQVKARMQTEGTAMVGFQPYDGLNSFRLLYMNPAVTLEDVDAVLAHIARYGSEVTAST